MKLMRIELLKETKITAHDDLTYGIFNVPFPSKLLKTPSNLTNYLPNQLKLGISKCHCKDADDSYYNLTLSDWDDAVFHIQSKNLSEINNIYNKIIANQPLSLKVFENLNMQE